MKKYQPCSNNKVIVLNQKTAQKVFIKEVILLRASVNYTHFVLCSGTEILVAHSIKFFEDFLATQGFIRVHRRYMVNPQYVTKLNDSLDMITLSNGHTAQIARRRKINLTAKL